MNDNTSSGRVRSPTVHNSSSFSERLTTSISFRIELHNVCIARLIEAILIAFTPRTIPCEDTLRNRPDKAESCFRIYESSELPVESGSQAVGGTSYSSPASPQSLRILISRSFLCKEPLPARVRHSRMPLALDFPRDVRLTNRRESRRDQNWTPD